MKVLLQAPVPGIGTIGQICTVPDGYARNYLIPKKLAVPATPRLVTEVERVRERKQANSANQSRNNKVLAESIQGRQIKIFARASNQGHLFGSVGVKDVCLAVKSLLHVEVTPDSVILERPFTKTGQYTVQVQFAPDVVAVLDLVILSQP